MACNTYMIHEFFHLYILSLHSIPILQLLHHLLLVGNCIFSFGGITNIKRPITRTINIIIKTSTELILFILKVLKISTKLLTFYTQTICKNVHIMFINCAFFMTVRYKKVTNVSS